MYTSETIYRIVSCLSPINLEDHFCNFIAKKSDVTGFQKEDAERAGRIYY